MLLAAAPMFDVGSPEDYHVSHNHDNHSLATKIRQVMGGPCPRRLVWPYRDHNRQLSEALRHDGESGSLAVAARRNPRHPKAAAVCQNLDVRPSAM